MGKKHWKSVMLLLMCVMLTACGNTEIEDYATNEGYTTTGGSVTSQAQQENGEDNAGSGESGRGFAVVADQIQKLADQSSQSSLEIEETSRKLMEDSAKAVEIMQQMQGIITSQSESMQDTQVIVKEVLSEINDSMHGIEMIKGSAKRLEQSRNEVVRVVEDLSEIAQDNASGTQRTYDAAQEANGSQLIEGKT